MVESAAVLLSKLIAAQAVAVGNFYELSFDELRQMVPMAQEDALAHHNEAVLHTMAEVNAREGQRQ